MKLILPTSEDSSIFFGCVNPEIEYRAKGRKLIGRGDLCVLLLTTLLCLYSCGTSFLDGPFNQGRTLVPELLYANNETHLVTFWDEDLHAYRTYDQQSNAYLRTAVFSLDPQQGLSHNDNNLHQGLSRNYMITGSSVVPLTRLDNQGLHIQAQDGCIACHKK